MTEPLYIDNSTLKSVARCSTEAVLRYHHDYASREEAAPLKSGFAGHEALAVWYRGGTKAEAMAKYEGVYRIWAEENVSPDDRLSYSNTSRIMDYWFDTHPVAKFPFKVHPEFVEVGFQVPLLADGSIIFVGRMDMIVEDFDGSWFVDDHKFTGRISEQWLKALRVDSQLTGYIWAAQQHTAKPVYGAYITACEFKKLPSDPTRKCKTHATMYDECAHLHFDSQLIGPIHRTDYQIEQWHTTAVFLARKFQDLTKRYGHLKAIHKVRMQGVFHNACAWCNFYDFCASGRPLNMIDSFMIKDPWRPFSYSKSEIPATGRKP